MTTPMEEALALQEQGVQIPSWLRELSEDQQRDTLRRIRAEQAGDYSEEWYHPVTENGQRVWVQEFWRPGSPQPENQNALRRRDIPAGEAIRDAGITGTVGTPQSASAPVTWPQPITNPTGSGAASSAASRAAQLMYQALRTMPFLSPEFLGSLQQGRLPPPSSITPQALALLTSDSFLSDTFFSLIEANGVYPSSYLAEVGRYQPTGATPRASFF